MSEGRDKLREVHVDIFKEVLRALVSRVPFGIAIDESQAEDLVKEATTITDEAILTLKPVILPPVRRPLEAAKVG